jgi:hypothetical protein
MKEKSDEQIRQGCYFSELKEITPFIVLKQSFIPIHPSITIKIQDKKE